ncbi:hypothetical protein ON010_g2046 [Phytophthora cinnamomi]|nr:hypothetical protein ON010_g2046 [Phytophthora cinnamomi]
MRLSSSGISWYIVRYHAQLQLVVDDLVALVDAVLLALAGVALVALVVAVAVLVASASAALSVARIAARVAAVAVVAALAHTDVHLVVARVAAGVVVLEAVVVSGGSERAAITTLVQERMQCRRKANVGPVEVLGILEHGPDGHAAASGGHLIAAELPQRNVTLSQAILAAVAPRGRGEIGRRTPRSLLRPQTEHLRIQKTEVQISAQGPIQGLKLQIWASRANPRPQSPD